MKTEVSIEQLLRWRLALAKEEAPPPPGAAQLLDLARPWWEQYRADGAVGEVEDDRSNAIPVDPASEGN
jgi:hypothetical protein